jgi:hypothetical protein
MEDRNMPKVGEVTERVVMVENWRVSMVYIMVYAQVSKDPGARIQAAPVCALMVARLPGGKFMIIVGDVWLTEDCSGITVTGEPADTLAALRDPDLVSSILKAFALPQATEGELRHIFPKLQLQ